MADDLAAQVRGAMNRQAARRQSFDASHLAAELSAPIEEIAKLVEQQVSQGVLSAQGYRVRRRVGELPLVNPYSGELIVSEQATDVRRPEEMPTVWTLSAYDDKTGIGELTIGTEKHQFEGRSAVFPIQVGTQVRASWARSAVGSFNIVASIEPAELPKFPMMTISQWLEAWSEISGKLKGITEKRLLKAAQSDAKLPGDWEVGDEHTDLALTQVLQAIEGLAAHHYGWEAHRGLLLDFVWLDDATDECVVELQKMLGVGKVPGPFTDDFEDFLAAHNEAAVRAGRSEQAYIVDNAEGYLLIKLRPEIFSALVAPRPDGMKLLDAHAPKRGSPRTDTGKSFFNRLKQVFFS